MERPKRTDTEDDIMEMQKQFFTLKSKERDNFKPAASVIKMPKEKRPSLFAQKRKLSKETSTSQNIKETFKISPALGEIIEKSTQPPPISQTYKLDHNYVLGDILEKSTIAPMEVEEGCVSENKPFPEVEKLVSYEFPKVPGKSIFAMSMEMKSRSQDSHLSYKKHPSVKTSALGFGQKSVLIKDEETAKSVHNENIGVLSQMTEEEILEEKRNLLKCIDSKILDFIKAQKHKLNPDTNACVEVVKKIMKEPSTSVKEVKEPLKANEIKEYSKNSSISLQNMIDNQKSQENHVKEENFDIKFDEIPAVSEILAVSETENWVNFNIIEKDKIEWMKEIPKVISEIKPGEPFEARFDWKGVLLPYVQKNNQENDDRELYMHGEEPFRPGYTLNELFRLARSNVMQQRCSAYNSIHGILNIYNQGFYDGLLEIPITKIFFLLRYGMDENSLSLLEITSKGLAMLFYNETDETVLDFIYETPEGILQPIIETNRKTGIDDDEEKNESITTDMKKLKLTNTPFSAKVDDEIMDDENSKAAMTDYHLAENDLLDCLLRTNIIQRIYYILNTVRPENTTVLSCLKILIRLARTNTEVAKKIINHDELMQVLVNNFLPGLQNIDLLTNQKIYNYPQYLVLKLFRIIMSHHVSLCIKLLTFNVLDIIKNYIYTREDIKGQIIRVQIESFRIIRILMHIKPDINFYKSLLPAFRYLLEWHYQNCVYEQNGPFLIRQHGGALLGAITSGPSYEAKTILREPLEIFCSKWFYLTKQHGINEFSQSNLLSCCINCVDWYLKYNDFGFDEFIDKYLSPFINSKVFIEFANKLENSSVLLKCDSKDRRNVHPPLPNLGSILVSKKGPKLIISQCYSIFLLNNLFKLTETLVKKRNNSVMFNLMQPSFIDILVSYLKKISWKVNKKLATNFMTKNEIRLTYKLIIFKGFSEYLTKSELLQASFNLINCLSSEHIEEVEKIFETILFNQTYLNFEENSLKNWRQIYLETFVYPHRIVITSADFCLSLPCFPEPILPSDWPYMLLKSLLNKYLQLESKDIVEKKSEFPESEIIKISLTFTRLLELNGLQITSPTEKLMYLMISFLGSDSAFLEKEMKAFLKDQIEYFYEINTTTSFKLGGTFEGKSKFENLYVLFLDHFQAASYGDDLFSSLVMVPLAQKYDAKWRKMVWSEHASVLRFLNCDENRLLGKLEAYLEPAETDISLIKCYARALQTNLLRENTIPYKIAKHHLNQYELKNSINSNNS